MINKGIYCHSIQHFSAGDIDSAEVAAADKLWSSDENAYITETAGFIPLPVKFKRFIENGLIAQFKESDFTSSDWRSLYSDDPDLDISPSDEFDDVQVKLELRERKRLELLKLREQELSTVRSEADGVSKSATEAASPATVDNSELTE